MKIQSTIDSHDLTPRNHNKVMNATNRKLAANHALKRVPRHFAVNKWTNPGSGAYRFDRRSDRTKLQKQRRGVDPNRPNFVSGRMLAGILASSTITATANSWTWRARNTRFPLADHRRREIEEVAPDEIAEDLLLMAANYTRLANRPKYRRRRRRRVR